MKKKKLILVMLAGVLPLMAAPVNAGIVQYDRDIDYSSYIKYDRFLDVEIWTDDDEYYQGDNIYISFQADQDCYVAIYNIDTHGRVNLLYPADQYDEAWIEGGAVYRIPDRYDDYDLTVQGPEGVEYLQIVASRKPFVIPDWYESSDLILDDDPFDFMDFINATYFLSDHNIKRAFDVTSFRVMEWHRHYFRPVHVYHHYDYYSHWDWGLYGAMYIDYPFGATIYIDGAYWGIAPLFIPRIYYGWHYITVYDRYGYCWEDRISVVRRKSIVLDNTVIRTRPNVKSRFKEVRGKAYLDPVKNGYPEYQKQVREKKSYKPVASKSIEGHRYKMAENKSTRSNYTGKYQTSDQSVSKERSRTYESGKQQSRSEPGYKSTKIDKRSTGKSQGEGKSIKSNDSPKSPSEGKSSKSYRSRKSSKSPSSTKSSVDRKSSKSKSSGSVRKSSKSSGNSGSVKKSSSRTTSSGSSARSKSGGSKSSSGTSGRSGKRGR